MTHLSLARERLHGMVRGARAGCAHEARRESLREAVTDGGTAIASATSGAVEPVEYDSAQKRFTLAVMPSGTAASIRLHL
jgi:hypothetical protein